MTKPSGSVIHFLLTKIISQSIYEESKINRKGKIHTLSWKDKSNLYATPYMTF